MDDVPVDAASVRVEVFEEDYKVWLETGYYIDRPYQKLKRFPFLRA
jgi:hypothetical protein